jgi:hypothetical protein
VGRGCLSSGSSTCSRSRRSPLVRRTSPTSPDSWPRVPTSTGTRFARCFANSTTRSRTRSCSTGSTAPTRARATPYSSVTSRFFTAPRFGASHAS